MKTINITLYSFDELSEEVQKQIIEQERWNIMEQCMFDRKSDYYKSLCKFEELMNIYVSYWNVDYSDYSYEVIIDPKYVNGKKMELKYLSGKLLVRYLQNNILPYLLTAKQYSSLKYVDNKPILKRRSSRIFKECDCPLTGMCYDTYLIDPILQYLRMPNPLTTYRDLMNKCVDSFFEEWHKEYRYWADEEDAIREELHNNQYEDRLYCADGRVYDGPLDVVA